MIRSLGLVSSCLAYLSLGLQRVDPLFSRWFSHLFHSVDRVEESLFQSWEQWENGVHFCIQVLQRLWFSVQNRFSFSLAFEYSVVDTAYTAEIHRHRICYALKPAISNE